MLSIPAALTQTSAPQVAALRHELERLKRTQGEYVKSRVAAQVQKAQERLVAELRRSASGTRQRKRAEITAGARFGLILTVRCCDPLYALAVLLLALLHLHGPGETGQRPEAALLCFAVRRR